MPVSRTTKINKISQAHLAPGMSLARWQEIMNRHGLAHRRNWTGVSEETIDAIIAEISAIVINARKKENPHA